MSIYNHQCGNSIKRFFIPRHHCQFTFQTNADVTKTLRPPPFGGLPLYLKFPSRLQNYRNFIRKYYPISNNYQQFSVCWTFTTIDVFLCRSKYFGLPLRGLVSQLPLCLLRCTNLLIIYLFNFNILPIFVTLFSLSYSLMIFFRVPGDNS